jgi:hypothetical protein
VTATVAARVAFGGFFLPVPTVYTIIDIASETGTAVALDNGSRCWRGVGHHAGTIRAT